MLGTLEIRQGDEPLLKPPTLKSQALLAYLVLHRDQPQPRERLAGLFWGDRPERKARRSLTTALWHIRRCLPDKDLIWSDALTVQFDPQAGLWLDIEAFAAHAARDDLADLQAAVGLYRGDFLAGMADDWIVSERYRLQALYEETLARLMARREARGEHHAALTTAQRLLERNPLRADAHGRLYRGWHLCLRPYRVELWWGLLRHLRWCRDGDLWRLQSSDKHPVQLGAAHASGRSAHLSPFFHQRWHLAHFWCILVHGTHS